MTERTEGPVQHERVATAPLGLTWDEEDVLRDLLGSTPEHDGFVMPVYLNALHSLRLKASLHYSGSRGVDVAQGVAAVETIADYARHRDLPLRFYFHWDECEYEIQVGEQTWRADVAPNLLAERVARELRLAEPGEGG